MYGLSPWHLLIILAVVLIVVGPGKLPDTGAAIGRALRGFRDAMEGKDTPEGVAQSTPPPAPPAYPPQASQPYGTQPYPPQQQYPAPYPPQAYPPQAYPPQPYPPQAGQPYPAQPYPPQEYAPQQYPPLGAAPGGAVPASPVQPGQAHGSNQASGSTSPDPAAPR